MGLGNYLYVSVLCVSMVMVALVALMAATGRVTLYAGILRLFQGRRSSRVESPAPGRSPADDAPGEAPAPPKDDWDGTMKLVNVTDEQAVMIMAIVSSESGIPLDELRVKYIRLVGSK